MASTIVRWTTIFTVLVVAASRDHGQNYTAIPRWGQASAIIYDTLFISGGKTDPEHQYTYSSAPNSNDLLSLDLSSSFSLSAPPWSYVSGSQNTSTSQGPAIAFHTLTPYTSSDLLLFGGDAGFNIIETNADSAWLLNAKDLTSPSWTSETAGWASEPIRRVYHAAPSASGAIYILGGQKADGSQIGFPDSYLFNAVADSGSPAFIPLSSTTNAPTGLFGHAAHVLPGGTLLVFGGFFSSGSSNTPSPLSTIYTLDTTSASPTWSIQNATGGTTPSSRRGFASVLLDNGKILIHGGADATLQTLYSDGAMLDTTQTPMSWSPVEVLSGTLGPRVGHFAAPVQGQVLFGFGWAGNAAANANLALYDPTSSVFQPTYTAPPSPASITTLPISPTAPGGTYPTSGASTGQAGSGSHIQSSKGSAPTSGSGNGQGGNGNGGQDNDPKDTKSNIAGVVAGSVLGFLAFVGLVGGGVYYALRRRERRAWMGIDANVKRDVEGRWRLMPEEDPWDTTMDDSPTHPGERVQMAGTGWPSQPRRGWGLMGLGALIGVGGTYGTSGRRRLDMLADEDARQFDIDSAFHDEEATTWSHQNSKPHMGKRRQGTGGSSFSYETHESHGGRFAWSSVLNASVTSLRNVGVALGVTATGAAAAREGMGRNVNPPEWWEKDELPLDPFADATAVQDSIGMEVNPVVSIDADIPMRPRGGEYTTSARTSNAYVDPFEDPDEGEKDAMDTKDEVTISLLGNLHDEGTVSTLGGQPTESSRSSIPRSFAMSGISRVGAASPGPSDPGGTSVESHDAPSSRTTQSTSNTGTGIASSSTDHSSGISSPTSPRTTSIIGAISAPTAPMRRSDSWWSRFSRTSFRDRHSFYDASNYRGGEGGLAEFRDPNPAPRLGPIAESAHSSPQATQDGSPSSATASGAGTAKPRKAGSGYAASTKSSIRTEHTADSELIARMDGRMEVVQRALSLTSKGTASPTVTLESPELLETRKWDLSPVEASSSEDTHRRSWISTYTTETESFIADSPIEEPRHSTGTFGKTVGRGGGSPTNTSVDLSSHRLSRSDTSSASTSSSAAPLAGPRPPRRALTGAVAARVSAYERRMSRDTLAHNGPRSPPADTKARQNDREEDRNRRGGVGYGLVPKVPLFVANPDHRKPSGST